VGLLPNDGCVGGIVENPLQAVINRHGNIQGQYINNSGNC
jgi:hypothetical protein